MSNLHTPKAVVCVANEGNEISLQLWKIYKPLRDVDAESEGLIRVIDESGEDYLFPAENFIPIELPRGVKASFERAAREQRRRAGSHIASSSARNREQAASKTATRRVRRSA